MNLTTDAPKAHPALIAPKQRRSRELAERVLAATLRALRHTSFHAVTMADIAREAGVSVGSIYQRFPTKERLLCFLADRLLFAEPDGAAVTFLRPLERAEDLRTFLRGYLNGIANVFVRHRAVLAPLSTLARESRDSELRDYLTRINAAADERLKQAMLRYEADVSHARPEAAIDFCILWMGAAMRERILFGDPVSKLSRLGVKAFVDELTQAACAYLATGGEIPR